ncbi:uncharacterized protein STEHIDRAFT_69864 [Stereum hirsutum FP-91666 SS1]|uniref:Uncharacterized protein n=1 Tax=Stereum hirsutum (strain FP-91666) TaxID=721885 RepID=R7RWI5_STEHR|nr:uncharacterized protein STEHIDRAFT_69864 [Stereum hirsutum FP-91666 SS1]EIM79160.1 hypothetical protein STEHIDRAFT_69864 [Stereum hirsutum FP-91666 SS1]
MGGNDRPLTVLRTCSLSLSSECQSTLTRFVYLSSLYFSAVLTLARLAFTTSFLSCSPYFYTSVATSDDGTCINANSLVSLAIAGNTSLVQPINSWLTGACSQSACSNESISNIITNVTTGCATDLASLGIDIDNSTLATIIADVQQYYPTVRQIACLQDANELCVTETLDNVQTSLGTTLTINNIVSLVPQLVSGDSTANTTALLQNVTCSNCGKEAFNVINSTESALLQSSTGSTIVSDLQSQCGSSFTDGSTASGISQTASGLSTDASDSSAVSFAVGSSFASLLALASGFMVLA